MQSLFNLHNTHTHTSHCSAVQMTISRDTALRRHQQLFDDYTHEQRASFTKISFTTGEAEIPSIMQRLSLICVFQVGTNTSAYF